MRSAACDAAVSVLASQPNTETQPARASESRSTAATDRIAAALEEEEEQSFDALAVRADSEQDTEKLVCEFRRLLTRSVRLRGRVANPPTEQLSDAACWNCGRGGHYRRSCPLANTETPRRPPNRATNRVRTLFNKTQGVVLSVNTKWAAELAGKVNGRSVRFLVDTGAAVSVIRESEVNMAGNVRISRHGSRQIVAANGECLETVGTAELDIKLGDKFLARHSMIVARNLSHPCLLGTDFLRPRKALIDLGDGRIKLDGIWLNLESPHTPNDRNQREAEQECDICLLETVTLPARTEVIVTGKSNANWTTKDGFFEPAPKLVTNHSVMAACSLSRTHRGTVPVRLLNGTDTPITLFKDAKLGTYSTTYSTASTRKTVEAPNAESTRKYSELIENMAKLSHDQIIATDEYNTGRTNACKHSINTGDASPIKQPPRRIPYHQKETVRRMLSEMTNHKVIELSCGPWSSPIVLVKKKGRFVPFLRRLLKIKSLPKKRCPTTAENRGDLRNTQRSNMVLHIGHGEWILASRSSGRRQGTASIVARTLVNEFICRYGAPEFFDTECCYTRIRHRAALHKERSQDKAGRYDYWNQTATTNRDSNKESFHASTKDNRSFLGLLLLSGYHCLADAKYHLTVEPDLTVDAASKTMSRNRFHQLKRFLHFSDNQNLSSDDEMSKVSPLYQMLNDRQYAVASVLLVYNFWPVCNLVKSGGYSWLWSSYPTSAGFYICCYRHAATGFSRICFVHFCQGFCNIQRELH
ncbi:PiggyBac transposable element-derived protein 2 [Trichinella patagoniensis]|uniref:PiggyBac transposable element-derived protein 2 n=1 Tax=Trichinella patagoniensis TaxID=990121 RepID=A0A0V0ZQZ2_9BILA|nr:PiggyBac transposable element-derived protein 2 [Trichinella patagoniensis]